MADILQRVRDVNMPKPNHMGITKALDREDTIIAADAEACRTILHQFRDRYVANAVQLLCIGSEPYRCAMQTAEREIGLTNGDIAPQDFANVIANADDYNLIQRTMPGPQRTLHRENMAAKRSSTIAGYQVTELAKSFYKQLSLRTVYTCSGELLSQIGYRSDGTTGFNVANNPLALSDLDDFSTSMYNVDTAMIAVPHAGFGPIGEQFGKLLEEYRACQKHDTTGVPPLYQVGRLQRKENFLLLPQTPVATNEGFLEPVMGVATSSAMLDAGRAGITEPLTVMLLSSTGESSLGCLPNWTLPLQFGLNCLRFRRRMMCDFPWANHEEGVVYRVGVIAPNANFWRAFDNATVNGRFVMARAWKPITRVLPTTNNVMLYADFRSDEIADPRVDEM